MANTASRLASNAASLLGMGATAARADSWLKLFNSGGTTIYLTDDYLSDINKPDSQYAKDKAYYIQKNKKLSESFSSKKTTDETAKKNGDNYDAMAKNILDALKGTLRQSNSQYKIFNNNTLLLQKALAMVVFDSGDNITKIDNIYSFPYSLITKFKNEFTWNTNMGSDITPFYQFVRRRVFPFVDKSKGLIGMNKKLKKQLNKILEEIPDDFNIDATYQIQQTMVYGGGGNNKISIEIEKLKNAGKDSVSSIYRGIPDNKKVWIKSNLFYKTLNLRILSNISENNSTLLSNDKFYQLINTPIQHLILKVYILYKMEYSNSNTLTEAFSENSHLTQAEEKEVESIVTSFMNDIKQRVETFKKTYKGKKIDKSFYRVLESDADSAFKEDTDEKEFAEEFGENELYGHSRESHKKYEPDENNEIKLIMSYIKEYDYLDSKGNPNKIGADGEFKYDDEINSDDEYGDQLKSYNKSINARNNEPLKSFKYEEAVPSIRRVLSHLGFTRFNTNLVRNLFFISNVLRIIRLQINREFTQNRNILKSSHFAISPSVTEYGISTMDPNEVLGTRYRGFNQFNDEFYGDIEDDNE